MKNKFNELRNDELEVKLGELKQELFNLRFSHATGQLSNPKQLTNCKRDITANRDGVFQRVPSPKDKWWIFEAF